MLLLSIYVSYSNVNYIYLVSCFVNINLYDLYNCITCITRISVCLCNKFNIIQPIEFPLENYLHFIFFLIIAAEIYLTVSYTDEKYI